MNQPEYFKSQMTQFLKGGVSNEAVFLGGVGEDGIVVSKKGLVLTNFRVDTSIFTLTDFQGGCFHGI